MKIRLELNGPLRVPEGGRVVEKQFKPGITVGEVISQALQYPAEQVRFLVVTREGSPCSFSRVLEEDCSLQVFMRLGGG